MQTSRELLGRAAKAYGDDSIHWDDHLCIFIVGDEFDAYGRLEWNPLEEDGDALRLAIECGLEILPSSRNKDGSPATLVRNRSTGLLIMEAHGADKMAATRRAIVRAAGFYIDL